MFQYILTSFLLAPARKYVSILVRVMFQYILTSSLLAPARKYVSILVCVMFQCILTSFLLAPARKYVSILVCVMFQRILTSFLLGPAREYVSILVRVMFQYIPTSSVTVSVISCNNSHMWGFHCWSRSVRVPVCVSVLCFTATAMLNITERTNCVRLCRLHTTLQ